MKLGFLESSCVLGSFEASWTSLSEIVCPKEQNVPFSRHRWQLVHVPRNWSIGEHFVLSTWHFMQELHCLPLVAMRYLLIGGLWDIERSRTPKIMVDWRMVQEKLDQLRKIKSIQMIRSIAMDRSIVMDWSIAIDCLRVICSIVMYDLLWLGKLIGSNQLGWFERLRWFKSIEMDWLIAISWLQLVGCYRSIDCDGSNRWQLYDLLQLGESIGSNVLRWFEQLRWFESIEMDWSVAINWLISIDQIHRD
jgi:hypothetical protein